MTHWESVSKAVFTILGLIALIAAVVAMFYTTASDALGESQSSGFRLFDQVFGAGRSVNSPRRGMWLLPRLTVEKKNQRTAVDTLARAIESYDSNR